MIPYISNMDNNAAIVVFILMLGFAACMSNVAYIFILEAGKHTKRGMCLAGIIGMLWAYSLLWLFAGDPVWWSKPIGIWLKN